MTDAPIRSLLILPGGASNPLTGGGQRSNILYSGLKQLGPVDVLILGATRDGSPVAPDPGFREAFYPDSDSLNFISFPRFAITSRSKAEWLRDILNRFLFISRTYGADAELAERIAPLVRPEHRLIAFRYSLTYAVTGIGPAPGRGLMVDIDDRDDQKFLSKALAQLSRLPPARAVFRALVAPALRRRLEEILNRCDHLWYATPEDALPLDHPSYSVFGNVPYRDRLPEDAPPPSQSMSLLFVGIHAHLPNRDAVRWFLRQCWPRLSAMHPTARFRIVGMGDWASLAAEFPGLERVDYVGTVDDIVPEYTGVRAVIAPVFEGGGSKIKVVEACAYARPVVAVSHSLRGFRKDLTEAIPFADDPEGFIALCDRYLSDPAGADAQGARLRQIQQAGYSRPAIESQIRNDAEQLLNRL